MQGERRTTELAWLYDRTVMVTQSVHNDVIDAFGIRFGASIMIGNAFAIRVLDLNALRHFERRLLQKPSTTVKLALALLRLSNRTKFTIAMCHSQFVAVSRCSILTPAEPTDGQLGEA
jgi:hypothetical protein